MLSLSTEEQKETITYISPIVNKNPLAPVLVNLRQYYKESRTEEPHAARETFKQITQHIPVPPTKPRFKEAYQAIAAHFKTTKEPVEQKPEQALAYAAPEVSENPVEKLFGKIGRAHV